MFSKLCRKNVNAFTYRVYLVIIKVSKFGLNGLVPTGTTEV